MQPLAVARSSRLSYDVPVIIRSNSFPGQDNVGQFGDKFRKAREKKDISLNDVSNVTKISARMLRAIEEEHFEQLPGGVFNKGFIRTYAKHLGLNDEQAVADYLACVRQAETANQVSESEETAKTNSSKRMATEKRGLPKPAKPAGKSQSSLRVEELPDLHLPRADHIRGQRRNFALRSDREFPWGILALTAIIIVLGGGLVWIRHSHRKQASAATAASLKPAQSTVALVPAVPPSVSSPAPVNQPAVSAAAAAHRPDPNAAAGNAKPNAATNKTPTAEGRNLSANLTAQPLTLVIRATETSWISVQADGKSVSQEMLIAPARVSVRASREIVARIGNSAGITFLWNGQEIPADGSEGEVKTFVFDLNGMRAVPSGPPDRHLE